MFYLGIDLGGTNIVAGVVDDNFNIIAKGKVKTNSPRPAEQIVDDMAQAAKIAMDNAGLKISDIKYCGVGSPGSIDAETGTVLTANNLKFDMVPLKQMLESRLNCSVFVANDANAAAFGEMLAGAGRGTSNFVAITLGTGVGGGVIIDNKILTGCNGAGGELGHTVIVVDGEQCSCGRKGCWEAYASATALVRQTKEAMLNNQDSGLWELVGGKLDKVSGRTSFDGMRNGDKIAKAVVDNYVKYVAVGLVNMVNIFQPEVICIGGGISNEGETLIGPIREILSQQDYAKNNKKSVVLKTAQLGNDAGVIGAAFLGELYCK